MNDMRISSGRGSRNQDAESRAPLLNLHRSFYGRWWYLLPDVLDSGVDRNATKQGGSLSEPVLSKRIRTILSKLRKKLSGNISDVLQETPQGL